MWSVAMFLGPSGRWFDMAVDIRTRFMSNLGTVVSGSVSDNPMLEKGLIVTTGELTVAGNVQRPRGTPIDLAYAEISENGKPSRITRFPRRLRVMSCSADPFRNITTFQLGCKLALASGIFSTTDIYYTGEHQPTWWDQNEFWTSGWWWIKDPSKNRFCKQRIKKEYRSLYSDYVWKYEYDRIRKVVPTIQSWELTKYICSRLDLQMNKDDSRFYKLRFQFLKSHQKFDGGYLELLDDLIVSEACYGFLDMEERLVIRRYPLEPQRSAPVLREDNVVDIQSISTANNPDRQVLVSYAAKERRRIAGKTLAAYTNQEPPD